MIAIDINSINSRINRELCSRKVNHEFFAYSLRESGSPVELIDQENKLFNEQIALLNGFLKTIEEYIISKNNEVVGLDEKTKLYLMFLQEITK